MISQDWSTGPGVYESANDKLNREKMRETVRPDDHLGPQLLDEQRVHDAVEYLRVSAGEIGLARARCIKAGHMPKVIRAILMAQHNEMSAAKAEVFALSSDRYLAAVNEEATAVGEYEKIRSLRDAAGMVIEVWRTASSNARSSARL